jgi:hypothetical protein
LFESTLRHKLTERLLQGPVLPSKTLEIPASDPLSLNPIVRLSVNIRLMACLIKQGEKESPPLMLLWKVSVSAALAEREIYKK